MPSASTPSSHDTPPDGIPVTWPALIEQHRDLVDQALAGISDTVAQVRSPAKGMDINEELLGASGLLAQVAITYGPAKCRQHIGEIVSVLPSAFQSLRNRITPNQHVLVTSLLSLANVAECCGHPLPGDLADAVQQARATWPETLAPAAGGMSELERWDLAFVALIARRTDLIPQLAGTDALSKKFSAWQTFAFNVPGLLQYLATAIDAGAALDEVIVALEDFAAHFPHALAAGALQWDELMYAGRVVLSTIGGKDVSVTAQWMHDLVTRPGLSL